MFSMALYDKSQSKIYFIRDRAGVKPLFYYHKNGVFLFASELKAFHQCSSFIKELDKDALAIYFKHGNIPAPHCIFKNTFKLNPGHWLCIDLLTKKEILHCYWNAFDAYNQKASDLSYDEAKKKTEELMESAFNYRMVADVPVGVFLSGGYDSTAVASLLSKSQNKINTYTIGFESEDFDESKEARKVANHLGTNHHEYICKMSDAMDIIPLLPDLYDEPFGDSSAIPTTLVSRIARKYVTVALSADAGDELFAGYPRHKKGVDYLSKMEKIPSFIRGVVSKSSSIISRSTSQDFEKSDKWSRLSDVMRSKDQLESFNYFNETFSEEELRKLLSFPFEIPETAFNDGKTLRNSVTNLNKILAVEYKTYLVDDILQKVDRATMAASLEGREPFLDHRLLEFVATLPDDYKLYNGVGKRILKDIVHQYVPIEIMNRPKMGFGVPVKDWLRLELKDLFMEVMDRDFVEKQNLFDPALLERLKTKFIEGKLHDTERIWFLFVFQLWYKRWM
jgi:asparagine synthase (glutamine-hydrolysing)